MKIALGLFHFNVQEVAGDSAANHRYCTQVVLPFLKSVSLRKHLRVTFEMSGSGLEFLAENYPAAIDLLRTLIADDRLELVSCTYAPTLWVAFPRRDLEQSMKANRRVLEHLGLRASRVFFAQEGFFGSGLEVVGDWFDVAVCKDDTLRMLSVGIIDRPCYRLGKLTVVIGANHLLNELAAGVMRASREGRPLELSSFHEARIQEAINSFSNSAAEYIDGRQDGLQWHWYHLGSAHHFTTTGQPQNADAFFCDLDWMAMNCRVFDQLLADGYQLGFVGEFARHLGTGSIQPLPTMIEGSWNPNRTRGVYVWMGRQEHRWQGGGGILPLAWRARKALRQSESAVESLADPNQRRELQTIVDDAWKHQVLAESSDPMGCAPLPCEVTFGRQQGERVLQMCAELSTRLCSNGSSILCAEKGTGARVDDPLVTTELLGAEGSVEWRKLSDRLYVCEARLRGEEHTVGIRFKRDADSVVYCPSACEHGPVTIALDQFRQSELYLPLANGFISLRENLHLIRDNCSVAVAARVSNREPWITFAVEGSPEGRLYEWRFFVAAEAVINAVRTANRLNNI